MDIIFLLIEVIIFTTGILAWIFLGFIAISVLVYQISKSSWWSKVKELGGR